MGLFDKIRSKNKQGQHSAAADSSALKDSVLVPGRGRMPFPAYRGKEPYIFISYAHKDSEKVFREIRRFYNMGYNVWYDEGISPGNEWTDEIARALSGCSLFVVMITPNITQNVQNEINYALDEKKPFIAIHLDPTELNGGLKLQIGTKQAILKYNMTEEEYIYKSTSAFERLGMRHSDKKTGHTAVPEDKPIPVSGSGPTVSPAPEAAPLSASSDNSLNENTHPWGDWVPEGTAFITDKAGNKYTAIGNSLLLNYNRKKNMMPGFPAGEGESYSENSAAVYFRDLKSFEDKEPGIIRTVDCYDEDDVLDVNVSRFAVLWFLDGTSSRQHEQIELSDIESVTFDWESTPDIKPDMCTIHTKDGVFHSPVAYLYFSENRAGSSPKSCPPEMCLTKEWTRYGNMPLNLKKIIKMTATRHKPSGIFEWGDMDVTYSLKNGQEVSVLMDGMYSIFAVSANTMVRDVERDIFREIEF